MSETIYIDGEPLSNFGGQLADWNFSKSLTNSILTGKNYAMPSLLRSDVAQGTLTATIHVAGRNTADAHMKASRLTCRLNNTVDLQMPDGMLYRSALSKVTPTDFTRWIVELSLEFTAVPHGPYALIDPYTAGNPIVYDGTAPAGVKIEFDAPKDIQNMTLKIVKNLETKFGTSVKFSDAAELYRALISGNTSQTVTQPGKNLLGPKPGTITSNGITCTVASDGTITLNGTATGEIGIEISPILRTPFLPNTIPIVQMENGSKYTISKTVVSGTKSANESIAVKDATTAATNICEMYENPVTITAGTAYSSEYSASLNVGLFRIYINTGNSFQQYAFRFQFEQSASATSWVPFVPESPSPDYPASITGVSKVTVNGTDYSLPQTLYSLPTGIADNFEIVSGQGTRQIGKMVLNGTESWTRDATDATTFRWKLMVPDAVHKQTSAGQILCSHYPSGLSTTWSKVESITLSVIDEGTFYLFDTAHQASSLSDWKAWLAAQYTAGTPVTVLYQLAVPAAIAGTPRSLTVSPGTLISNDGSGTVTTTSGNTQQDIQLTSIPSGSHISIDGIDGKITQNGVNKFADSNLVDFPSFDPAGGTFAVQTDVAVSNLKIGYYPTYL